MDEEVRKEGGIVDGVGFFRRNWVRISVVGRYYFESCVFFKSGVRNLYV